MKLAACYIVRNEAGELDRSIHSLRHAVDELLVVDTGSTDATLDIAASWRARILSFPWQDHFGKARNFTLEHVKSPWIIFLDADEYFRFPKSVRPAIQGILESRPELDAIMLTRYNVDTDAPERNLPYDVSLRILRNSPELRYQGRIHEMLQKEGGGSLRLAYGGEELSLTHTGYSSLRNREKEQRNLRLLEQNIREGGASPFDDYNLSVCYFGMEEYEKALIHSLRALDSNLLLVGGQGSLYHIAIESMRQSGMPPEDMLPLTQAAIRELPSLPEFYGEQGMVLCAMGRLDEAADCFKKAMDIFDHRKVNHRQGSYFTEKTAAILCRRLGEIAQVKGREEDASYWFRRADSPCRKDPAVTPGSASQVGGTSPWAGSL